MKNQTGEIPDEIVTDPGTNYDSAEFSQFCQRKKIKHRKSSAHQHQSNCKAESVVNIAKSLLRKIPNLCFESKDSSTDEQELNSYERNTIGTKDCEERV